MFKSKTVFVVGAGASKEAGLPVGFELASKIAAMLDIRYQDFNRLVSGDQAIAAAIQQYTRGSGENPNDYQQAAWRIRDAMPQALSIDNFIDAHYHDTHVKICGKLGIVRAILEAEGKSRLKPKDHPTNYNRRTTLNYAALSDTWYDAFQKLLFENVRRDQIASLFENISFIIFNYDRCIEHFLFHALQNYYNIPESDAAELVNQATIVHPYGVVGPLEWQRPVQSVAFGTERPGTPLIELANQIKTFTEQNENNSNLLKIHSCLQNAQFMVFLGFAYHELNVSLLATGKALAPKRVIGTAMGISSGDTHVIMGMLHSELQILTSMSPITLLPGKTCFNLFQEYFRTMSSG